MAAVRAARRAPTSAWRSPASPARAAARRSKPVGTVWIAVDVDGEVARAAARHVGRPRRDPPAVGAVRRWRCCGTTLIWTSQRSRQLRHQVAGRCTPRSHPATFIERLQARDLQDSRRGRSRQQPISMPTADDRDSDGRLRTPVRASTAEDDFGAIGRQLVGRGDELRASRSPSSRPKYLRLAAEYDNYRKRTDARARRGRRRARRPISSSSCSIRSTTSRASPTSIRPRSTRRRSSRASRWSRRSCSRRWPRAGLEIDRSRRPDLRSRRCTRRWPPSRRCRRRTITSSSRVFQVGYLFNGQLLRPARVVVKQWNG